MDTKNLQTEKAALEARLRKAIMVELDGFKEASGLSVSSISIDMVHADHWSSDAGLIKCSALGIVSVDIGI